jgi:hypothetical protein
MGDAAGAVEDCARVVSIQEEHGTLDPSAIYSPDALRCLGDAELSLGRVGAAIEHLERSVSFEHREDPSALAAARFALARALRAGGRDPERATELARTARATYGRTPKYEKEIAAIDRWLAQR